MQAVREPLLEDNLTPRRELPDWNEAYGVVAGITVAGERSDLDFGLAGSSAVGEVVGRWRRLREDLKGFDAMVTGRQVHGSLIREHRYNGPGWTIQDGVDGHVTGEAGLLLTVTVADCVPVFLYWPETGRLALLHAGWRGIAADILEKGMRLLLSGAEAAREVLMHMGPAICGDCYEVGVEVLEQMRLPEEAGRHVDLRALLAQRAGQLGIQGITRSALCVRHDTRFFSHRKTGSGAGRLAAYIGRRRNLT